MDTGANGETSLDLSNPSASTPCPHPVSISRYLNPFGVGGDGP